MRVILLSPPFVPNFMRNARWDVIGQAGGQWYPIYLAYCAGLLEKSLI
jgi:ascorbate-specific PTS system EIIC-type component UlaA